MANTVGFRFRPSDEEIFDHYLRLKNLGGSTSHIDQVISTVNICSFDPWDLPSQSMIESIDQVWYFFGRKENRYNRGDRQSRKTKSGFWKKTGVTMDIMRKRSGNRDKIGEKRVLVFHFSKILGGSKSDWVMHEYVATFLSPPNQMMTYAFCKVKFKGEERDSGGIEHRHSLITTHLNNSGGFSTGSEESSFDCLHSQELENPRQFSGFLSVQEEAQLEDAMRGVINNLSTDDWNSLINHDDEDQGNIMFVQEDRNDYTPKKSLTGVFIGHSSDDSDSDSISAITSSIQTSSTCDSFGSSNHLIDQITDPQKSPNSTIKLVPLTQEVSKSLGTIIDTSEMKNPCDDVQEAEMGEYKMGQEIIKNKRAGFFYRIIQRFIKKIHLCASISRT